MKKPAVFLLSHGLAVALGWLSFHGADMAKTAPARDAAARVTKKPRAADTEEGRRILVEMRQGWGTEIKPENRQNETGNVRPARPSIESMKKDMQRQQAAELEEIRKQSLAVVLPADPATELTRLAAGREIRDTAAFAIAWLRADPGAALRFLEGSEVLSRNSNMTRALEIWVAEAGAEKVAGTLDQAPAWQAKLAGALMRVTAAEDPAKLDGMLESLEGKISRQQLIEAAFRDLPEDKRAAALAWIQGSLKGKEAGRAVMMMALGMNDNVAAKAFLKQAVEGLSPDALSELKGWGNYGDIMRSGVGPDSPMEERVAAMLAGGIVGKSDEERLKNARASIVSQDVSRWMGEEKLREAVKYGDLGAGELWQEAEEKFPQYGATEKESLLRAVFSDIAGDDPEGALKLLEQQGQGDQAATYVLNTLERIGYTDIERAVKLTAQLPQETMRQNLDAFDRQYSNIVAREAAQRGSFWTEWLRRQPAGVSKDLMLHYTARQYFKTGNEALGTELKGMVRDPTVKSWPNL